MLGNEMKVNYNGKTIQIDAISPGRFDALKKICSM